MIELYDIFKKSNGVAIDSRSLIPNQLFIALKGENFDGNKFVEQAIESGALHIISSDSIWSDNDKVTVVDDCLATLQQLSTYHRTQLSIPVVGITGSNGKTTTKELMIAVLQTEYNVKGTKGNLNNHIGVPLTLLSFDSETEIGIVEMGANHQKEIEFLCSLALPDYGLITNYGKAHLEGFGGIDGVIKGKSEMYEHLYKSNKTAVVARWDDKQIEKSKKVERILTIENETLNGINPYVNCTIDSTKINTQITGIYNYNNILFAATIGKIFKVSMENIRKGLESYLPSNNRSQIINYGRSIVILDAYNANPSSMEAALKNLADQDCKNKIAILGDMFEVGKESQFEHQLIADLAMRLGLHRVILIGTHFNQVTTSAMKFKDVKDFGNNYVMKMEDDCMFLIKGSRGMKLERILELIN
jgi:UDP-N-acetylmuramoyl-tripeptide--D-alanyl-D-alanine ligase